MKILEESDITLAGIGLEDGLCDGVSGAFVTFVGTPRVFSQGKHVRALHYEAYKPMAEEIMNRIIADARRRWPLEQVIVKHRLGVVAIGEISIFIQVAASHRREAFAACEFLVDSIKKEVPIWKKELYTEGGGHWVHCDREKAHDLV